MKKIMIHQWKDWILEYVNDNTYEFKNRGNHSVRTVQAKDAMDAENQCREILRKEKE